MQERDDQRLVEDDQLSATDLKGMEQPSTSSAVSESTVDLTEVDGER